MDENVLISLIIAGGAIAVTVVWKLLDIARRAMELDREHPRPSHTDEG